MFRENSPLPIPTTPDLCSVDGCTRPVFVKKRGLCRPHYCRWQRHGDPTAGAIPLGLSVEERFWYYVKKTDDHWLWTGPLLNQKGLNRYGLLYVGDGETYQVLAHRWSYVHLVGPIPEGTEIDHLCRETTCVRPDHLEAVPHRVNCLRGKQGWNKEGRRLD